MIVLKTSIRPLLTIATVLLVMTASQARAGFVLVETGLTINGANQNPALATVTFGGTTIGLAPLSPQTFTSGSGLNLIDVSAQSTTTGAPDTGSFNFAESFVLVGTANSTGLTESVTLSGTFNLTQGLMGAIISNMGSAASPASSISVMVNSGSGFTLTGYNYSQPSPSSSVGNPTNADGNLSLTIIPATTVPEPSSLALVGLGLVGLGGIAARRRRVTQD